MKKTIFVFASLSLILLSAGGVSAQSSLLVEEEHVSVESDEWFNFELRGGPYVPDVGNNSFEASFPDDKGLMWAVEIDALLLRIPYFGQLGGGLSLGWSDYEAQAASTSGTASEKTSLTLIPLGAQAVLYLDVLAREFNIPFVFLGKLGLDTVFWNTNTGARDDAAGTSFGLKWGLQAALELDFIERDTARNLDEEYGINHTRLFIEFYGSTAGSNENSLPVGDPFTWALGLAFTI